MELAVRLGAAADVDSLARLWMAMVEHHRRLVGGRWPIRPPEQAWTLRRQQYHRWLEEESGFLFVAEHPASRDFDGYLFCRLIESGPTFTLGPAHGEVDSLVVAEEARGAGLGAQLLEACRQELERRGIHYWSIGVVEANRGAAQLYERLGFLPWTRTMLARVDSSGSASA